MPWFPVDDGFAFHRKAVAAGNAAVGLWVRAGSWCAQQLTDGFVPDDVVGVLGTPAQAARLVKAGLWTRTEGGYQFHEWSAAGRNKTRAEVEKRRRYEADKKARARAAREDSNEKHGKRYARTAVGVEKNADDSREEKNTPFLGNPQVNGHCPPGSPEGVPWGVPEGVRSTHPIPSLTTKDTPSGVSLPRTPTRPTPRELARTAHSPEAHRLVEQYAQTCNQRPPSLVLSELAVEVDKLLAEDWPPERITSALAVLGEKGLGARFLPRIAHEVTNRVPNGHIAPQVSQTDVNIAAFLRGGSTTPPSLRALPGGTA